MTHASDNRDEDDLAINGLAAFEQQLGNLVPASSLDQDRLLFEAGAAHERKQHRPASCYAAPLRYAGVAIAASLLTMLTLSISGLDTVGDDQMTPMLAVDAEHATSHELDSTDDHVKLLESVVLRPKPSPAIEKPVEVRRVSALSTLSTLRNPYSDREWANYPTNLEVATPTETSIHPFPNQKPQTNLQLQRELSCS